MGLEIINQNLKETGIYLRTLRETHEISREEVASRARTSVSQIERIENGRQETRSSVMLAILQLVNGSVEDIQYLLLNGEVRQGDGKQMAFARLRYLDALEEMTYGELSSEQVQHYLEFLDTLTQEELNVLMRYTKWSRSDPEKRKLLLDFLQPDPRVVTLLNLYYEGHQRGKRNKNSEEAPRASEGKKGSGT